MYLLLRPHVPCLFVRSRVAETSTQARPRSQPRCRRLCWTQVARRDSQVPGESLPYLCHALRFRPVRQTSPYRPARCCPRYSDVEDTCDSHFGTQYRGFDIRRLRFKQRVTSRLERLASGWWLTSAGRESNPLDSYERFLPLNRLPPFPGLSWRYGM